MNKRTGWDWAEYFGIEIIDDDGWRQTDKNLDSEIDALDFSKRISVSTVRISNREKFLNFAYIFG